MSSIADLKKTPFTPPATPVSPTPTLQISEDDVRQVFKKNKRRKAPGPDGVSPTCLKTVLTSWPPIFTQVFNRSLELCEVPSCFKRSTIIPVPKKPKINGLYVLICTCTVLIQSEQKGWQNHSGPLTSSTLPLCTVTVWSTLQSSEHQNDQTQEQFLPSGYPSHEHLTLSMEHTTLFTLFIHHTYFFFFISNLHISELYTHNFLYYILCFCYFVHSLFVYYSLLSVSCPVAVILLHCGASVTITNSSYV